MTPPVEAFSGAASTAGAAVVTGSSAETDLHNTSDYQLVTGALIKFSVFDVETRYLPVATRARATRPITKMCLFATILI